MHVALAQTREEPYMRIVQHFYVVQKRAVYRDKFAKRWVLKQETIH
jgi:hypothetical protein